VKGRASSSLLRELKGRKKLQYLLDYYKFPLFLAGVFLYFVIWFSVRSLTHKEYLLYLGFVNFAPSETLTEELTENYRREMGYKGRNESVLLQNNLFLSSDENSEYHPYTYATKIRILGSIDAEQLDLVLMDEEAFDAFSQNGYLTDLQALLSDGALPGSIQAAPEVGSSTGSADRERDGGGPYGDIHGLYDAVQAGFRKNILIKEDNSVDLLLGNESEYSAVTAEAVYGIDLSAVSAKIRDAELNGTVYLGIIENSPRKAEAVKYLNYLIQEP
jgi:hypothetical protein